METEELPEKDPLEGLGEDYDITSSSIKLDRDETVKDTVKEEEVEVNDDFNPENVCKKEYNDYVRQAKLKDDFTYPHGTPGW